MRQKTLKKEILIKKALYCLLAILIAFPMNLLVAPVANATDVIPRDNWTLKYVDSEETNSTPATPATNAFDGIQDTFWTTEWSNDPDPANHPAHNHEIQINLGDSYYVRGFRYLPRQPLDPQNPELWDSNGRIDAYEFYVSEDGLNWGVAVATGNFVDSEVEEEVLFAEKIGSYIRLVATSEVNGNPWTSIAELNVLGDEVPTLEDAKAICAGYAGTVAMFPNKLIQDYQLQAGPVSVDIPAGTYKVTLVSHDGYPSRDTMDQPEEQWYATLRNSNDADIVSTGIINDLEDLVKYAMKEEVVNSNPTPNGNLVVLEDAISVIANHRGNPGTGANSVYPVCAVFEKIETCEAELRIDVTYFANFDPQGATLFADISDNVYVGDSLFGQSIVTIPLTTNNRTNAIVDNPASDDIPGLHIQRGEDTNGSYFEISTYGFNHGLTRESLKANTQLINATITDITNGPGGGYENPLDGICGITEGDVQNDLPGNDEYSYLMGANAGTICNITNVHRDRVKIYYEPTQVCGIYCGNGILETSNGEACDDGNNIDGDGCSAVCQVETIPDNPAIAITKTANPTSLPVSGGNVDYEYVVTNIGNVSLSTIVLDDDQLGQITSYTGDTNSNTILETTETWTYTISANITADTTNIAIVEGYYNAQKVEATDNATVIVDASQDNLVIAITKTANPTSLPVGGGSVDYSYVVTNPGNVPLSNIVLNDDKLGVITSYTGDDNTNDILETIETWTYTISANITANTTNVAIVEGEYDTQKVDATANASVSVSSGGGGVSYHPAIRIIKTPEPRTLPVGGGEVVYTYEVTNPGHYALSNVTLVDDKCDNIEYKEGDNNTNDKLDRGEIWEYTCQSNLTETTMNTVVVTGESVRGNVTDTTTATVTVPTVDLAIKLEKTANPESLSEKGGLVTYSYEVSNEGIKAISDVTLVDNKCAPVVFVNGDTNRDNKLDPTEVWNYSCESNITETTTNIGTVKGQVDGIYATDTDDAIVRVPEVKGTAIIPKEMPKTGRGGDGVVSDNNGQQILFTVSILLIVAVSGLVYRKKYQVK